VNEQQVSTILITLLVFGFIFVIIAAIVVAVIVSRRREQERTRQLASVAPLLGWQFTDTADLNWIPNLETFALFSQGHGKRIKNAMYGEIDGVKAAIFDYRYTVGGGKSSQTFNQTVVYFESRNLNLPFFSLRHEQLVHKLISAFGYQDIDFDSRPLFSSEYLLRGPDEPGVRKLFNDALLNFYETNLGVCTDGGGNQLFIFRPNQRAEPHDTQSVVNWALQIQRLYGGRW